MMHAPLAVLVGSFFDMCVAGSRLTLNVAIRLSSMIRRNSSSGCGPSLVSVRLRDAAAGGVDADVHAAERLDRARRWRLDLSSRP